MYFVAEHSVKRADPDGRRRRADRRGMNVAAPPRRIWLCADDYGISPGVNRAIRELLERGRINATSVMMVGPAIGRDEAKALQGRGRADSRIARSGCTSRSPRRSIRSRMHFRPLDGGMFLPLAQKLRASLLRRYDREIVRAEIAAQLAAFKELFGRAAGLCRRPSARAAVSAAARRLPDRGEARRAERLGAAVRPQPAARPPARRAEGAAARQPQRAISRPRQAGRHRLQSGLRRRL